MGICVDVALAEASLEHVVGAVELPDEPRGRVAHRPPDELQGVADGVVVGTDRGPLVRRRLQHKAIWLTLQRTHPSASATPRAR